MITWDDEMTTGVMKLDRQHKKLIEKYNELYEAIDQGRGREVIGEILDFLEFYADWHFGEEETCMDQYQCPVARRNKQAHAEFLLLFGEFHTQWQISTLNKQQVQDACAELGAWIENHIRRVDAQLASCLDS